MTKFFLKIYDFLSKRKAISAVILLIIIVLCVISALRLEYKENITDFLPSDPEKERYTSVYDDLSNQGQITVIFSGDDMDEVMNAIDDFEENWHKSDTALLVNDLRCKIDDGLVFDAIDFIRDNQPLFLTDDDYRRMDSLLAEPDYVATCMSNIKRMLAFPTASFVVEGIQADPLNLYTPTLQRLTALNATEGYRVEDDYLFNEAGDKAFAFFSSPFSGNDTKNNAILVSLMENVIKSTSDCHQNVKISAVGAPTIAVTNAKQVKKDSFLSISLAIVLIFSILMFTMARKRNLMWLGISILFGWIFALAVIALFKTSISIIVVGIGSVIVGIAVNYPLHFLDHIKQEPNKREALKDVIQPLVIGNITTVAAFACLIFVKAEAMHDLGLFGALMLVGTILFVMIFLPLFAVSPKKTHKLFVDNGKEPSEKWRKIKIYAFWPLVVITLILSYFSKNTSFDSDLHNINYMTEQQKEDLAVLSESLNNDGKTDLIYLVSEGDDFQEVLRQNEILLENFESSENSIKISGPNGLLPSIERQQHSLEKWADFWERHADIAETTEKEAINAGFNAYAFSTFVQNIDKQYVTKSADEMEALSELSKTYTLRHDNLTRIVNFGRVPADESESVKQQLRLALPENCYAFNISDVGNNLVNALSDDFDYILYVCSIVVFFFLCLSFGRLELSLLAFLPLTVGWAWILGIMDLTGLQFNIVNIILATFIFGQGDDYTIFITEGLLYEYAYGKKMLKNYRNSVILSGILMFIGIGTLIFAKHPAMKSLAEVAIIGMATVVFMACYLPPIVFGWLTKKKGQLREVPLTLKRIVYTILTLLVFFIAAFVIVTPLTLIYIVLWPPTKKKRYRYHQMICGFMRLALKLLPGVKYHLENKYGETFDKPSVIIANHQSHLDLLCVMMLNPKVVLLTTDWVWRNPIYGVIIRFAEFYPVSDGYDKNVERLQSLVKRGYSVVVFPEGTRSVTGDIIRFHKGAFQLAQALNIDILPIFIHGVHDVMPKNDFVLREGQIHVEICKRMLADELKNMETRTLTSYFHEFYITHYEELRYKYEDTEYVLPYVRYKYIYKGNEVERTVRANLKKIKERAKEINGLNYNKIIITNSGYGELAWVFALVNRNTIVYAYEADKDKYLIASHCTNIPDNLCFIKDENYLPKYEYTIDYQSFIR
jgi:1-acyl-sn-glycerol-3-phosphate acyltransferase